MLVRKKLKEGTEQWKKSPAELWTELCREVTQEVGAMGVVLLGKEDNFKRYGPAFDKFRPFYPTFFRFNRTLCNRRLATLPSIPRTRADLQKLANLPTRFTKTASGDNWLILNTVQDQNKELIIGFVSPAQLALMKSSPTWYCDGTFDCVLAIEFVNQVWILVANTPVGVSVPVAFFLTERRTEDTYQQILTTLRDKYGVTGLCQPQPALPDEDCKGHLYG